MYANNKMQYHKQLQEQKSIIKPTVYKVFEGFLVEKDFSSEQYRIMDATGKSCLQFEFMDHKSIKEHYPELYNPKCKDFTVLHISALSKCGANNGNRLLALVDELAKSIPFVEYISLTDASNIRRCNVRLNLNELKILTSETGESWYNRWGYTSPTHHAGNMRVNSEIRNAIMREFLDSNPLLKSEIMDAFPELNINGTVRECVKHMSDQIRSFPEEKHECNEAQINKINALNVLIGELSVEYSKGLVKPVSHGSHGGYKRSATKRSATKRSATKRSATKRSATKRSATKRGAKKRGATKRSATKRGATKRGAKKRGATKRSATKRGTNI
jgi:hypothetical protein